MSFFFDIFCVVELFEKCNLNKILVCDLFRSWIMIMESDSALEMKKMYFLNIWKHFKNDHIGTVCHGPS